VRLLFSLDDPADVLRGYRYVSRIASADAELIRSFKESLARLADLEGKLKERTARNLENRQKVQAARAALAARKEAKEKRFMDISLQRALQERLAREYEKDAAGVIARSGLSDEERDALLNKNYPAIKRLTGLKEGQFATNSTISAYDS
jgi:peptidoglycan hydrolase CwlO-like protein